MKWRYWARFPIWGLMVLLMARGLISIVRPAPPPKAVLPPPPPAAQGQQAQAWASAFAREYLTWDPMNPGDREQRLRPYIISSLDMGSWALGKAQPQTVTMAIPWLADPVDAQRALITVQVTTTTQTAGEGGKPAPVTRTQYLAVPVYESKGHFAVYALPLLAPMPGAAGGASPPEISGKSFDDSGNRVRPLVEGYWRALTAGKGGEVEAYMLPGSIIPAGYGGQVIYRNLADLQLTLLADGNLVARGAVLLQDPVSQAELRQAFSLTLAQKDGRWYITVPVPQKKGA